MKTINKYWQLLLGFFVAILGGLVLTNRKGNKTKSKLNDLDREDNKNLDKIAKDRNKKIKMTLEKHESVLKKLAEEENKAKKETEDKIEEYEDSLKDKSNEDLANLFNKRR